MSILSRYQLSMATYNLTFLTNNEMENIVTSIKDDSPVLKTVKILSLSLINPAYSKGQVKDYFDMLIRQTLSLQKYDYTEAEVKYLVYFVLSKHTPFLIEDKNIIQEMIASSSEVLPKNEVYEFIVMFIKYALLDGYTKEIYSNPELISEIYKLLAELSETENWYVKYLETIQNDPFVAGRIIV